MIDLTNIDYVSIEGRNNKSLFHLISYAEYAAKFLNFKNYIIITPNAENIKHKFIKFIKINPLNDIQSYNLFCVKELKYYINSDFCILYQEDGAISNPNLWREEFLFYDYIGAPWPSEICFEWTGPECKVGNGGFSLRSKKFLEISSTLEYDGNINEDAFLTITNYDIMKNNSIKIPNCSIAKHFSIEIQLDNEHTFENSFGFHGMRYDMLNKFHKKIYKTIYNKNESVT